MAVCIVDQRGDTQKESCSFTDANGINWCFKAITNVRRAGFDKAFVCCGHLCNCKLFYSSPTDYIIEGVHCRLFDHEREFRKRQRHRLAIEAMAEDCTRRPCEIVRIVKEAVPLTQREEASLTQFVLRKNVTHTKQFPKSIDEFVIPEELKHTISGNDDVGDTLFLLCDSSLEEPHKDRFIIFSSFSMRQRARPAREIFADGTYRSVSNIFATLYTLHTVINNISYPIFFVLTSNEQKLTFKRVFTYIKTYMTRFDTTCVVHVDCQLAAIHAFSEVFRCRIQLCLFHQNQAVWMAVSKFGLAAPYDSKSNVRLQFGFEDFWVCHFFLPKWSRANLKCCSKETPSSDLFASKKNLSNHSKDWFHTIRDIGSCKFQSKCGASTQTANEQTIDVKVFITRCVEKSWSSTQTPFSQSYFDDESTMSRQRHSRRIWAATTWKVQDGEVQSLKTSYPTSSNDSMRVEILSHQDSFLIAFRWSI